MKECYRKGNGEPHDEAFLCSACEKPVCGYCATVFRSEWICPDCGPDPLDMTKDAKTIKARDLREGDAIPGYSGPEIVTRVEPSGQGDVIYVLTTGPRGYAYEPDIEIRAVRGT